MSVVDHGRFTQPSLLTLISFSSLHKIPIGEVPDNPISVLVNSLVVMKCSWIHFKMDRPQKKTSKRKHVDNPCTVCALQVTTKMHWVMCDWQESNLYPFASKNSIITNLMSKFLTSVCTYNPPSHQPHPQTPTPNPKTPNLKPQTLNPKHTKILFYLSNSLWC